MAENKLVYIVGNREKNLFMSLTFELMNKKGLVVAESELIGRCLNDAHDLYQERARKKDVYKSGDLLSTMESTMEEAEKIAKVKGLNSLVLVKKAKLIPEKELDRMWKETSRAKPRAEDFPYPADIEFEVIGVAS